MRVSLFFFCFFFARTRVPSSPPPPFILRSKNNKPVPLQSVFLFLSLALPEWMSRCACFRQIDRYKFDRFFISAFFNNNSSNSSSSRSQKANNSSLTNRTLLLSLLASKKRSIPASRLVLQMLALLLKYLEEKGQEKVQLNSTFRP